MQDAIGVVLRWEDDTLINVNTADGQWADTVTYFPWDLDQDGIVTTTDVDTVMGALGQPVNASNEIADLNGDGFITPTDAISVINRLGVQVNPAVVASRDRPDLVGVFVDAQPDYLVDGLTRFTFAVQNQGTAIADTFAVDILFSDNQQMGNVVDELVLQTVTIEGGLAAGETVEQTVVLQLPTRLLNARTLQQESYSNQGAPGDVSRLRDYLGLIVDSGNTVFESDEVNNFGSLLGQGSDDITMHRWDVDGDGTVSQTDADLVSAQLGQTVAADTDIDFGFSVGAGFDFDGDGTVTQADVDAVIQRIGYLPNPGTVEGSLPPRPLTLALANHTDAEWITADPTLVGAIDPSLAIAALKVKLNGGSYADLETALVQADGTFTLDADFLRTLNGGNDFTEGADYTVRLQVETTDGTLRSVQLGFTYSVAAAVPLEIALALSNDTGSSDTDGLTADPTITGQLSEAGQINSLQARIGSGAYGDIANTLQADGTFTLDLERLSELNGGTLPYGTYAVEVLAQTAQGAVDTVTIDFTYELQVVDTPFKQTFFEPIFLEAGSSTFQFGLDMAALAGTGDQLVAYLVDANDPTQPLLTAHLDGSPLLSATEGYFTYNTGVVGVEGEIVSLDLSGLTPAQLQNAVLFFERYSPAAPTADPDVTTDPDSEPSSGTSTRPIYYSASGRRSSSSSSSARINFDRSRSGSSSGGDTEALVLLTLVEGDGFTVTYEQPDDGDGYTLPTEIRFGESTLTFNYDGEDALGSSNDELIEVIAAATGLQAPYGIEGYSEDILRAGAMNPQSIEALNFSDLWTRIGKIVLKPNKNIHSLSLAEQKKRLYFQENLLKATALTDDFRGYKEDKELLKEIVELGNVYAEIDPQIEGTEAVEAPIDHWLQTIWEGIDISKGINELDLTLDGFANPTDLILNQRKLLSTFKNLSETEGDAFADLRLSLKDPMYLKGLLEIGRYYPKTQPTEPKEDIFYKIWAAKEPEDVQAITASILPEDVPSKAAIKSGDGDLGKFQQVNGSFDAILSKRNISITLRDYGAMDGDIVSVWFNDEEILEELELSKEPSVPIPLELQPGENIIKVKALNTGDIGKAPVTVEIGQEFEQFQLYGEIKKDLFLDAGETSDGIVIGLPQIYIDGERYPEAAKHVQDVLGEPTIVTLDRAGRESRGDSNTNSYRRKNGLPNAFPYGTIDSFDIDEAPPASTVSEIDYRMRPIPADQNEGAGSTYARQINEFGAKKQPLPEETDIEYYATDPVNHLTVSGDYNSENNLIVSDGKKYIYGGIKDDQISGNNASDIEDRIYGDEGNDVIRGRAGNDIIFGGGGNDELYGDSGIDIIHGGPGDDIVYGGGNTDHFMFNRTWDGHSVIGDYQPGIDVIVLYNVGEFIFEQTTYPSTAPFIPGDLMLPSLLIKDVNTGKKIATVVNITDPNSLTIRYAT